MALVSPVSRESLLAAVLVATLAVYCNTLLAGFTFDDNFAVINNGDVNHADKPLLALFFNDFWGQNIRSDQSHKSYRPLTILSLRLQRVLGTKLLAGIPVARPQAGSQHDNSGGLDARPFHLANVLTHACNTYLVFWLALVLCAARDTAPLQQAAGGAEPSKQPASAAPPAPPPQTPGHSGMRRRVKHAQRPSSQMLAPSQSQGARPGLSAWLVVKRSADLARWSPEHVVEALLAALLFGLHPVHTEAVAGIVGHAELLGAMLSILAFLAYVHSTPTPESKHSNTCTAGELPKLLLVVVLTLAGALAKEIGITVAGAMVLYEVLMVPWPDNGLECSTAASAERRRRAVRIAVALGTVAVYVRLRGWLAGDHLVRIYRKVENPLPWVEPRGTRMLNVGHLHARYAGLLLAPLRLSADWSFACVPLLERWADPRNLGTAALYTWLAWVALAGQPWRAALRLLGLEPQAAGRQGHDEGAQAQATRLRHARWRLVVAFGFIVGPFFPASNVLFYVGTFIGERLLYFPSIGFCLLLAHALTRLAGPAACAVPIPPAAAHSGASAGGSAVQGQQQPAGRAESSAAPGRHAEPAQGGTAGAGPAQAGRRKRSGWACRARALAAAALAGLIASGYAVRTWQRNWDWQDEEILFRAAQKVCPDSAKVHLNSGIIERRYLNWTAALAHFERARAIEPGYCDPTYWVGLTLINQGVNMQRGLEELYDAISCKYVAAEAVTALNKIYMAMIEGSPDPARPLEGWARVLMHPQMLRAADACNTLERAASLAVEQGDLTRATGVIERCLEYLDTAAGNASAPAPPAALAARASSSPAVQDMAQAEGVSAAGAYDLAAVRTCVKGRARLLAALARHGPASRKGKHAVYLYIARQGDRCRRRDGQAPTGPHMQLIHQFQRADAEDAWLQGEWGEVLLAEGRAREAAMHLYAAAMLLLRRLTAAAQGGPLQVASMRQASGAQPGTSLTEADAEEVAAAALRMLQRCRDTGQLPMQADTCSLAATECQIHDALAGVYRHQLRHQRQGAPVAGLEDRRLLAEAASRQCKEQLRQRGCRAVS